MLEFCHGELGNVSLLRLRLQEVQPGPPGLSRLFEWRVTTLLYSRFLRTTVHYSIQTHSL